MAENNQLLANHQKEGPRRSDGPVVAVQFDFSVLLDAFVVALNTQPASRSSRSQPPQVKSAVNVQHLARRVVEQPVGDGSHGLCHIDAFAHAGDG